MVVEPKVITRASNNLYLYDFDNDGMPIARTKTHIPIKTIDELYLLKKCFIDTETLYFLSQNNVIVHFFNRGQTYFGNFFPSSKNSVNKSGFVLLQQVRAFESAEHRLYLAKQITLGHTKNAVNTLHKNNAAYDLSQIQKRIESSQSIHELMGIEGAFKKEYYIIWNQIIKNQKSFKFVQRSKRPPADNLNVLISYLNSRVYNIVLCEIYKTELDPRVSFLHEPNYRNLSLHLDVAEIFKPILADRTIFYLLNKKMLNSEHFVREKGMCTIAKSGIQIIEKELARRLAEVKIINKMKVNFRFIIYKEVNKIKRSIVEHDVYEPYDG